MSLTVHLFNKNGEREIEISNVLDKDAQYFIENKIKVSMEQLTTGDIVVYGCPYSDLSEESEIMVLDKGRSCEETLSELAQLCKEKYGDTMEQIA